MLAQVSTPLNIMPIEIVDDDALLSKYGCHIPVLQRVDNQQTLYWPFSLHSIESFIR
jgi:hypothetical protein